MAVVKKVRKTNKYKSRKSKKGKTRKNIRGGAQKEGNSNGKG